MITQDCLALCRIVLKSVFSGRECSIIKINLENYKELIYSLEEIVYPGRMERLTKATLNHQKRLTEMGLEPDQHIATLISAMAGEAFREAVALTLAVVAMSNEEPEKPLNPRDVIKRIK